MRMRRRCVCFRWFGGGGKVKVERGRVKRQEIAIYRQEEVWVPRRFLVKIDR